MPKKPISIIAQVAGSGTAATALVVKLIVVENGPGDPVPEKLTKISLLSNERFVGIKLLFGSTEALRN